MLNRLLRATWTKVMTPVAKLLLALGVSPDAVTAVGTLAVCVAALVFYPRGEFVVGTLAITAFIFSDSVDGIMARLSDRTGLWGAFLDSTLDRFADAAIFGALVLYFATDARDLLTASLALACLILGLIVSYTKARAEGLGFHCDVGIAERADRLVAVLVTVFFVGVGLPRAVLTTVLALLALASAVTVVQRMATVRRQALPRGATA